MALDGIYNVPDFNYTPRVEKFEGKNPDQRRKDEQGGKKKKKNQQSEALFESLADSLSQYGDEPFQFSG